MKGYLRMTPGDRRYDLSSCLIYRFRDIDLDDPSAPPIPYKWQDLSISEASLIPARFLIRHAIRGGQIWATWLLKGHLPGICGPRPAVCFTEMTVPEFLKASRRRTAKWEKLSSYALVLPKGVVTCAGGRPVIRGRNGDAQTYIDISGGTMRLVNSALPVSEHHRYVLFDSTIGSPDSGHEREWRWPLNCEPGRSFDLPRDIYTPMSCFALMPSGMRLDDASMRGIGVIVTTPLEAERVVHDILTKVDRGDVARDHYAFVLAHQAIPNWENLRDDDAIESAIFDNMITLDPYFADDCDAEALLSELDALVLAAETAMPKKKKSFERHCWLWLADNRHPLVRALINKDRIKITRYGQYLIEFPKISPRRSRHHPEAIIKEIAGKVSERFGISASSFVDDCSGAVSRDVPLYNGTGSDISFAYNRDWDDSDALFKTNFELPGSKLDATGREHLADDIAW